MSIRRTFVVYVRHTHVCTKCVLPNRIEYRQAQKRVTT